jgi:hypothetical protein
MASRQDDFTDLYASYRVADLMAWNRRRSRWAEIRRRRLLVLIPLLAGLAVVAEALVVTGVGPLDFEAEAALAGTVAALALAAGIVASAAAAREAARARRDTIIALAAMDRPGPDATEEDLAAWVNRVEAILGHGTPRRGEIAEE